MTWNTAGSKSHCAARMRRWIRLHSCGGPKLGKDVFDTDMLGDAERHIPPRHPSSCSHVALVLERETEHRSYFRANVGFCATASRV